MFFRKPGRTMMGLPAHGVFYTRRVFVFGKIGMVCGWEARVPWGEWKGSRINASDSDREHREALKDGQAECTRKGRARDCVLVGAR